MRNLMQALVNGAGRLLTDFNRSQNRQRIPGGAFFREDLSGPRNYGSLARFTLTDEVGRTLFDEYASHRQGPRGQEETGWMILGLREADEAVVLATLPAGAESNAGVAHVHFNSNAQALGSRIVRQLDRRLTILGVVHTHPGTLRHPSDGDYRGDKLWVGRLRGGEGIFGIGTVDAPPPSGPVFARQPKPNIQCMGDMRLSWYSLKKGDRSYRPLPYGITLGPDLARPLHSVWSEIETHADQLDRLYRQQAGVTFEVVAGKKGPALAINVPLAEPASFLRVFLEGNEVFYFLNRNGELLAADAQEMRVDRGVYLLLAELAAHC